MTKLFKLLILDVDGVLTDGKKYYDQTGLGIMKTFNDKDFTAIKRFEANGIKVVWLSGDININQTIAKNRNIPFFCTQLANGEKLLKSSFLPEFKRLYEVKEDEIAFVGDDLFDLDLLEILFWTFCPKDAPKIVKKHAKTLPVNSGEGVIKELYDLIEHEYGMEENFNKVIEIDAKEKY